MKAVARSWDLNECSFPNRDTPEANGGGSTAGPEVPAGSQLGFDLPGDKCCCFLLGKWSSYFLSGWRFS